MLNADALKADIKTAIKTNMAAIAGAGDKHDAAADALAAAIATAVIDHIKANAVVQVTVASFGAATGTIV